MSRSRPLVRPLLAGLALALAMAAGKAAAQQPPHSWLFGAWTGGLFPVPSVLSAEACLSQPVVIFTRDVVLRATLTETTYVQRIIDTARTTAGVGTEFRFVQEPAVAAGNGVLGLPAPAPAAGFGCGDPNVLHVRRRTDNEITFVGCPEFAYPLVRCGGR